VGLYWKMLPHIRRLGLYRVEMPNAWNFAFDYYYFVILFMCLAGFFFFQNYLHMFAQRRTRLARQETKSKIK